MKNSELMVGNWVLAPTEYRDKQKKVRVWQIRDTIIIGYDQGWYSIDRLAPIPITEDFLKANGFIHKCLIESDEYYPKGLYEWQKSTDDYFIEVRNEETSFRSIYIFNADRNNVAGIDIQYVHQLQNVLNILGIEMEVIV